MFNVITNNIVFTFNICPFAFNRSHSSFVPYSSTTIFFTSCSYKVSSPNRQNLKTCSGIPGACKKACTSRWPSIFIGVCSRFSKSHTNISFLKFSIYLFWLVFCWLQLVSLPLVAVILKNHFQLFSANAPAIKLSSLSEL